MCIRDRYQNLLYHNPGVGNDWIGIELIGSESNRSAIGALVEIKLKATDGLTRKLLRRVGTGGSFGASSLRLEIGLGQCESISEVRVCWPRQQATWESFKDLKKGKFYRIHEENRLVTETKLPTTDF